MKLRLRAFLATTMVERPRISIPISALAVFAALAMALELFAQDARDHHSRHHVYRLSEVGTFGGPWSDYATGPGDSLEPNYFNGWGALVGVAQTGVTDPFSPNCFFSNCYATDAFVFLNGALTNLGTLPGSSNSVAYGINDWGLVVGISETGSINSTTGYPAYHAVVWRDGAIKDLGTFGGADSLAFAVNDCSQVVGVAANDVPDEYAANLGPYTTWNWPETNQQRAFLWQGGALHDLGTLGGNDAAAYFINRFGQVAGISYTNTTPNATTGLPTQDPFLWDPISRRMTDLGTLGGTWGVVYSLNNRGQVVGSSNLAGDNFDHAFLWERGVMTDLGTLGGSYSGAFWLNDARDVVGYADPPNQPAHAVLWRHGIVTDLGLLTGDNFSVAWGVNAQATVVGQSCNFNPGTCRAFVWQKDGPMVDLNALVEPSSDLYLEEAYTISDTGEIYVYGQLPNGDVRIGVLTPKGRCDSDCERRIAEYENNSPLVQPAKIGPTLPAFGKVGNPLARRVHSSTRVVP